MIQIHKEIKMNFDEYFASKSQPFWKEGIMSLPERWKKVIKQNGSQQINLKQQISCIHFAKKKEETYGTPNMYLF